MALTKKNFEALASILASHRPQYIHDHLTTGQYDRLIGSVCDYLAGENRNFNAAKFLAASGHKQYDK